MRFQSLQRFTRRTALLVTTCLALLAGALWAHSYLHYVNFDPLMIEHRSSTEATTKEGTLFTYRGGVGVMLRRRFIPVDWEITPDELGWQVFGPTLHIGPAIARQEYAVGNPILDIAGVYLGHDRGPHSGYGPSSLVVDHVVALPLWLVTLLVAAWPLRAFLRWRHGRDAARSAAFDVVASADKPAPLPQAAAGS